MCSRCRRHRHTLRDKEMGRRMKGELWNNESQLNRIAGLRHDRRISLFTLSHISTKPRQWCFRKKGKENTAEQMAHTNTSSFATHTDGGGSGSTSLSADSISFPLFPLTFIQTQISTHTHTYTHARTHLPPTPKQPSFPWVRKPFWIILAHLARTFTNLS